MSETRKSSIARIVYIKECANGSGKVQRIVALRKGYPMSDLIDRQAAIDALKNDMASLDYIIKGMSGYDVRLDAYVSQRNQVNYDIDTINNLPTAQPEQRTGKWILDRSGAYCCSECMEPCAGYVMMKPRDKFCKMCGAKMMKGGAE